MDSKILLKIQSKVNASKVFLCDAHYFMAKWWSSNDIKNKQNGYPVPQKRFNWIRHKKGKLDLARSAYKWTYHLSGHSCPLNVPPIQIYLLQIRSKFAICAPSWNAHWLKRFSEHKLFDAWLISYWIPTVSPKLHS